MILGVGVDLVDVGRMEWTLKQRWAKTFVARVFSKEEIAVCRGMARPAQCLAARFAAKEALAKALGTGFSRGMTPGKIRVNGSERTQPSIELVGAAREMAQSLDAGTIHVSLSHTDQTACAFVVVEKKD